MDMAKLENKIRAGKGTVADVYKYAGESGKKVGEEVFRQIKEAHPNLQFSENEVRDIVSPILKREYQTISELMSIVINQMYKKAGTGLKAIIPEYNSYRENDIVEQIMEWSKEVTEHE